MHSNGVTEAAPSADTLCPNCRRLEAELMQIRERLVRLEETNARLAEENADLRAELRRGRRQAAPFSRDRKTKNPKRPGRRPGQGRFAHREKPGDSEPLETLAVGLVSCPLCGTGALEDVKVHEQYEVDLPEVRPRWRRYLFESGYCRACRRRVRSRHPEQVSLATGAAGVVVGPRTKALAADLKHRLGIPLRKSAELFHTAFGLDVTASALSQANARLAERAEPTYAEIAIRLGEARSVGGDDTGWRIAGEGAWLWVFTSPEATLYAIDRRRSHEVALEILGDDFEGVFTGDCAPAFDHHALAGWTQQKCLAHLLKDLRELEKKKSRGAVRFARSTVAVLRDALQLAQDRDRLAPSTFRRKRRKIERRLDALISEERRFTDPDNARLANRLRKQRAHLFTFLTLDGVEPTNNRAERMLRPAVLTRKTGGCNRSPPGARVHEVLASLLVTLRQQNRDILGYLRAVLTAPGEIPDLFPAPIS